MATANLDLAQTTANVISGQASFLDVTSAAKNYSNQDYISAGLDAASFVDTLSGMAHPPGVSRLPLNGRANSKKSVLIYSPTPKVGCLQPKGPLLWS